MSADSAAGAESPSSDALVMRVARVVSNLFQLHVELAKREADRDKERLIGAAICGALGAVLLAMVVVLLEAAAVVALHDGANLAWHWTLVSVAMVNSVVGALLLFVASRRAKAPIMPETRGMVQRTITAITQV